MSRIIYARLTTRNRAVGVAGHFKQAPQGPFNVYTGP